MRPFVWGLLLLLALAAGNILFFSSQFARESAADLLRGELSEALGREVTLRAVDFHLWTLTPSFELRGLVIPGPALGDPAVLRLERARARLSWRALIRRRLEVQQLDVERPQIYLRINPDGSNNLPRLRRTGTSQPQRVQLAVERLLIENGTFQLNERRARLDLTASALWARLAEAPRLPAALAIPPRPGAGTGAAGSGARTKQPAAPGAAALALDFLVTAQEIALRLPDARPYLLTLSARGRFDADRLRIASAHLAGPDLAARVDGAIGWRGDNEVDLGVTARMAAGWVNRVGYLQEPITGFADVTGRFTFRHEVWEYSGNVAAARVDVLRRVFRGLAADFRGDSTKLAVAVRQVLYDEAAVSGPVTILTGAGPGPHGGRPVELDLAIRGLALQPFLTELFPRQFAGPGPPVVELAARASGRLRYKFQSSQWRLGSGSAELRVAPGAAVPLGAAATAGAATAAAGRGLPLAGEVPLRMAGGVLSAGTVTLTAPGQEATVTGFTYDLARDSGRLDYRLLSHDTGALAPLFPPAVPRLPSQHWTGPRETSPIWLPNAGHGTASGAVTLTAHGYSARFDLDLQAVVSHSLGSADRLHGTLTVEPLAVENLRLEATAGPGALMVSGRIPLARPGRAVPDQPLELAVDAAQWPAAGLVPYLPGWFPVAGLSGEASGRLDLGGDFEPLTGQADAELAGLRVSGVTLDKARGRLAWDPARITVTGGAIETAAGTLAVSGSFDRRGDGLDFTLDGPALNLAAPPLAGLLPVADVAGRVALMATVGGTLERPRAQLSLRGHDLAWSGRTLEGTPPGEAQAVVDWDGELVRGSGSLGSVLAFDGGGRLDRRQAALRLQLRSTNLAGLARLVAPGSPAAGSPAAASPAAPPAAGAEGQAAGGAAAGFSGSLAGDLAFSADFPAGRYGGQLRLDELRLAYAGKQVANREPVVVDITSRQLLVRSFYLGEPGTGLEAIASGSIGWAAPRPLDLRVQSTISASWAKLFLPSLDVAGELNLLAAVKGTLANPELTGQAVLHDARLIVPRLATSVEALEGTLRFDRDRVVLEGLTGRLGGGAVRATGQLTLPGAGRTFNYRIDMSTQGVSLPYPSGWISRGDAALALVGTGASRQIQGLINLNRALYVEDLQVDPLQLLLRGLQRERVQVIATDDLFAKTQLNLSIQGPGALRVSNNVADLHGDVELTVVGTVATPVVFGTIQLESGGTLQYADNKYQVDRGSLTFANPNRIDPLIDLALKTEVQSYTITLNLSGTLERLNAKFSSNAELADIDIISLLAGGQRPELGAPPPPVASEAAGHAAASQFLAGQAASAVSSRVGRLFGLDRFRVDTQTLTQAGQPTSGVVITAGKRLSKNIFVTYVSNPSSPRLDVRQIEWQVAKNLTVLLTQSGTSYAVDVQRETRF
ncbi:MAG: translocation/assembly module TamB domain-containing protein [Acidobacteria bacterium]|nr:translocation/assembly module TamB domain-containing protein [Acidobacteriota bacterium]